MRGARDNQRDLWNQVRDALEHTIDPRVFDTWFRPIAFTGGDDAVWELTVPNAVFQAAIENNYAGALDAAMREVLGAPRPLRMAIPTPESSSADTALPVLPASQLPPAPECGRWLIDSLWMAQAVGILGGPPRAYKTWLALDMAVSVASGSPCLGVFPVPRPGPVLLYAAEDSAASLRSRLESIARARHVEFDTLDVRVITVDRLRLDQPHDQQRFHATVALHQPQLVILDPLVRIHSADENASTAVAALLGYFRALQRSAGTALVLVHHSGKQPSTGSGYSLRGSSDFYAWTDCLLYLERRQDHRRLMVEHRAAPGSGPFTLELVTSGENGPYPQVHLQDPTDATLSEIPLTERIVDLLSSSTVPVAAEALRARFRVRKQRLLETLRDLTEAGKIVRRTDGYALKAPDS